MVERQAGPLRLIGDLSAVFGSRSAAVEGNQERAIRVLLESICLMNSLSNDGTQLFKGKEQLEVIRDVWVNK